VRRFCFARKAVGAFVHPAFPAPSIFGGSDDLMHHPDAKSRRGNAASRVLPKRPSSFAAFVTDFEKITLDDDFDVAMQ
jgi:hypothetical protein